MESMFIFVHVYFPHTNSCTHAHERTLSLAASHTHARTHGATGTGRIGHKTSSLVYSFWTSSIQFGYEIRKPKTSRARSCTVPSILWLCLVLYLIKSCVRFAEMLSIEKNQWCNLAFWEMERTYYCAFGNFVNISGFCFLFFFFWFSVPIPNALSGIKIPWRHRVYGFCAFGIWCRFEKSL